MSSPINLSSLANSNDPNVIQGLENGTIRLQEMPLLNTCAGWGHTSESYQNSIIDFQNKSKQFDADGQVDYKIFQAAILVGRDFMWTDYINLLCCRWHYPPKLIKQLFSMLVFSDVTYRIRTAANGSFSIVCWNIQSHCPFIWILLVHIAVIIGNNKNVNIGSTGFLGAKHFAYFTYVIGTRFFNAFQIG